MKKLLFGILGLLVTISGWSAETNSGPISSVTVAGLVAQNGTPTPTTPIDIVSNNGVLKASKNLWNPNATTNYWIDVAGNLVEEANSRMVRIPANPNDVFTLSATYSEARNDNIILVSFRDSSDNNLLRQTAYANTSLSITLTAPAGTKSVCFARYKEIPTTIQAESGSTATTYRPYGQIYTDGEIETIGDSANHTATVATLLGVGDYRDTQNINTGAITKNVGVKVFDGTEAITAAGDNSYFSYTAEDKASGLIASVPLPISTHFQTAQSTGTDNIPDNGIGASSITSNKSIWFKMSAAQDTTAFKAFLADQYAAGTPVIVVYPLATETTESVAGQTMTTAPVNNRTGGVTGMTITTLLSSGASVVTTIAANAIKIATTAYNSARFSPVVTELNNTIATIRSVVTNTINQTAAIADLQATKQTRPDENCPAGKKCLLVEDNDGQPHWYEIIENAYGLPDGYTPLEYIESTGTQYIDTGITGSTNAIIDMQGTPRSDETVVFMLAPIDATAYQSGFGQYRDQIAGANSFDIATRRVYNVSYTSSSMTVNGVTFSYYIANNVNLALFGSTASNRKIEDAKLYSAKIYNNDTLLRDFVPAKNSSGVIGMYDTVSGNFFTNAGSGTFVAGPEI